LADYFPFEALEIVSPLTTSPDTLATPLLDIERGLLKLEKVAIRHRARRAKKKLPKRPLILLINSLHLLQDDEVGNSLLEMLQQKAETWAEAGIITVVLNRYPPPVRW